MSLIKKTFAALALTLAIAVSGPALADTFTLANDNGGDGFVNLLANGPDLFGANNGDIEFGFANYTTYTATALSDQTFNLNWVYHTEDDDPSFDPAGYVINGVFTQLTNDAGPNDQSGSFAVSVLTNDVYGIYVFSTDSCCGRADIAVTSSETPLPATLPLFATGLGTFGFLRWRRKRKAVAAT
jgi:hypothetical protein